MSQLQLGVILHIGYEDHGLAEELLQATDKIIKRWELKGHKAYAMVTVIHPTMLDWLSTKWANHKVKLVPNPGGGELAFVDGVQWAHKEEPATTHILRMHSKAKHSWRGQLLSPLISSDAEIDKHIEFLQDEATGSVLTCAKGLEVNETEVRNFVWDVARDLKFFPSEKDFNDVAPSVVFSGGAFFYIRFDLCTPAFDFDVETERRLYRPGRYFVNCKLHGWERVWAVMVEYAKKRSICLSVYDAHLC